MVRKLWVSDIPFTTTSIGSLPQTRDVKKARKDYKEGNLSGEDYDKFVKGKIRRFVRMQEDVGLDILVHGEPERTDMVEYFAQRYSGFTPIEGEVLSYGTRVVRPPIISGDIYNKHPFTWEMIKHAQRFTDKPMKGMLTGPVTMVQWSYPREDISKQEQFYQVAEAIRREVKTLVGVGINHIQIDEPALREGMPVNSKYRDNYLESAVRAFKMCYEGIPGDTVIYTHMCFSNFEDILDAINDMGVDVIHIEESKSHGKLTEKILESGFKGSVGLGVFDVHSPRIPTLEEMVEIPLKLLEKGADPYKIFINPDCGLKTRGEEAWEQLKVMVEAANYLRGLI